MMKNYRYFLSHGPKRTMRGLEMAVRLKLARDAQPLMPLGLHTHTGPV